MLYFAFGSKRYAKKICDAFKRKGCDLNGHTCDKPNRIYYTIRNKVCSTTQLSEALILIGKMYEVDGAEHLDF